MRFSFSSLSYQQKNFIAEFAYLFVVGVLSPFAVGLQIFSHFSYTVSLVLLNILQLPVIVLFYRVYLPKFIGKKSYLLATFLFPFYLLLYELSSRLSCLAIIHIPFIPEGYRTALMGAHPEDFTKGYFSQSIGYTCLVLLAATSLYVVKLLFKNQHNLYLLETEKLRLELQHLKSQVQPHFFFNTLNNMYALSVQNSSETPKMITDLSAIMRYVLYETQQDKVPLQQEIDFIKSYIRLENLRHEQANLIDFSIQGKVTDIVIEPMLFLPLIENTYKHALQKDMPNKWVRLILSVDEDELIFQAANAKLPNPNKLQSNSKQSGIGLANVRKRVALLYPNRHELVIHNEERTFTATLTIQLK